LKIVTALKKRALKNNAVFLRRAAPLLLLYMFGAAFVSAEEDVQEPNTIYVIRKIDFNITGRSLPFALKYHGKLAEGDVINGTENLERYIQGRTQLLVNQRVLEDDVRIEYTLDSAEADGKIPVDLLVTVRDTWNIMVFPQPGWDDNTGFDLTLKARDYNFFGTMHPLQIDLGYSRNLGGENKFSIDSDIPFIALGYNWNINFDNEFNYSWNEPLSYKNSTGVSMELPFKTTAFTFGLAHHINWRAWNGDDQYERYFEGLFNSVVLSAAWSIPTGLEIPGYGQVTYTPRMSEEIVYNPGNDDPYEWNNLRRGPFTAISQSLGFGRIDWIGNLRRGIAVSLNNSNSFNHNRNVWDNSYSIDGAGHFIITGSFGITGRLQLRQWFSNNAPDYNDGVGDNLRGILDNKISGDVMLSLNLEFPFKVWTAKPAEWFKTSKMRILNFEFYLSPIMDIGMVHGPDQINMYYTGGLEVFIFPEFMRSLYLRFSAGIDMEEWARTGRLPASETFIGLYHFF
jgi:hypothetical protein